MKTKRIVWTIIFLGITLAAIVMEIIAGVFHVAGTIPWTEYLATYVPWPFQLAAYVILAVWLPFHFWRHDHLRKVAYREGRSQGYADGRNADRVEAMARARAVLPAASLDLISDEKLADALRRRGWDASPPVRADGR